MARAAADNARRALQNVRASAAAAVDSEAILNRRALESETNVTTADVSKWDKMVAKPTELCPRFLLTRAK